MIIKRKVMTISDDFVQMNYITLQLKNMLAYSVLCALEKNE